MVRPIHGEPAGGEAIALGPSRRVTREGVVVRLREASGERTYALATAVGEALYPFAYLTHESAELDGHVLQLVRVTGVQRWIRGWPRPLIRADTLERVR